jgi:hypothetical protein
MSSIVNPLVRFWSPFVRLLNTIGQNRQRRNLNKMLEEVETEIEQIKTEEYAFHACCIISGRSEEQIEKIHGRKEMVSYRNGRITHLSDEKRNLEAKLGVVK